MLIDVNDESVEQFDLGSDSIVRPAGSALTMIAAQSDGARGLLVHGPSGVVVDTDAGGPVVGARYEFTDAKATPSGRTVLVTDSGNFQSVLLSFDRGQPSYFPGLALALDDNRVVTTQNIGDAATISVFDHAGEPVTTGRTASVRAGMITEVGIVLVTADGAIVNMDASSGTTTDGPQLSIGTIESGAVTTSGDRLVVTGSGGTAIVGADGDVIATVEGRSATGSQQPPSGSACINTTSSTERAAAQLIVTDFSDGSVVAEAELEANSDATLHTDASGCTIAASTSVGFDLIDADGVRRFDDGAVLALSLDGLVAAVERKGRIVLLATADAQPSNPIDLGLRGRAVHFTRS